MSQIPIPNDIIPPLVQEDIISLCSQLNNLNSDEQRVIHDVIIDGCRLHAHDNSDVSSINWKDVVSRLFRNNVYSTTLSSRILRDYSWKSSSEPLENSQSFGGISEFFTSLISDNKTRAVKLANAAAKIWSSIKSTIALGNDREKNDLPISIVANDDAGPSIYKSGTGIENMSTDSVDPANAGNGAQVNSSPTSEVSSATASAVGAQSNMSATGNIASTNIGKANAVGAQSNLSATGEVASANFGNLSIQGVQSNLSANLHGPRLNAGNVNLSGPSASISADIGLGVNCFNASVSVPSASLSVSTDFSFGNVGIGGGIGFNLNPLSIFNLGFGGGGGGSSGANNNVSTGVGGNNDNVVSSGNNCSSSGAAKLANIISSTASKIQKKVPNIHHDILRKETHINDVRLTRNSNDNHDNKNPRRVGVRVDKNDAETVNEAKDHNKDNYKHKRDQGIYTAKELSTAEGYIGDKSISPDNKYKPVLMTELGAKGVSVYESDGTWGMNGSDSRGNAIRDTIRQYNPKSVVGGPQDLSPNADINLRTNEYIISPKAAEPGGGKIIPIHSEKVKVDKNGVHHYSENSRFTGPAANNQVIPTHYAGMEGRGFINPAASPRVVNPIRRIREKETDKEIKDPTQEDKEYNDIIRLVQEMAERDGVPFSGAIKDKCQFAYSQRSYISDDLDTPLDDNVDENKKVLCSYCRKCGKPMCMICVRDQSEKKVIRIGNIVGFAP